MAPIIKIIAVIKINSENTPIIISFFLSLPPMCYYSTKVVDGQGIMKYGLRYMKEPLRIMKHFADANFEIKFAS